MASQGPNFPGTTANLSNAGTSENTDAWVNPGNVVSDNGTEATITAASYDSPDISQILVASNFGFSIPTGSTLGGITVEIDRRSIISNSGKDFRVQLATGTTFATLVGSNKAVPATIWPTTSTVATYGGAADMWGSSLTVAQVNASGFAVFLSCQANIANADVGVDYIRVTITYTPPNPTGTGAITVPSATVAGTGAEVFTATGAVSVPSATVAGVGAEVFTATGAVAVPAATVAGVGDHADVSAEGTGAITVPAATVQGTGSLILTGTGAIAVPAATVDGAGTEELTGTGSITVPAAAVAGTGSEVLTGSGTVTVGAPTVSGSGNHEVTLPPEGSGSIVVGAPLVTGAGLVMVPVTGTGAIMVPPAAVTGSGTTSTGIPSSSIEGDAMGGSIEGDGMVASVDTATVGGTIVEDVPVRATIR